MAKMRLDRHYIYDTHVCVHACACVQLVAARVRPAVLSFPHFSFYLAK